MQIEFLSVDTWRPATVDGDTVSLLIDGHILVDTGWLAVRNLMRAGLLPDQVDTLLFTHMHQDHYIALPTILFYLLNGPHDAGTLTIYGPEGVEDIVKQALTFAGKEKHFGRERPPRVVRLEQGMQVALGGLTLSCIASQHAAPGLCYRFEEEATGVSMVYSGDTEYFHGLAAFAKGAQVLIHEASFGARRADGPNPARHSSAEEAARVALDAGVESLYLVHCPHTEETLNAARVLFESAHMPKAGDVITL